MSIGERIQLLITDAGGEDRFVRGTGIPLRTVRRLVRGAEPSVEVLLAMRGAGVSPTWVLTGEEPREAGPVVAPRGRRRTVSPRPERTDLERHAELEEILLRFDRLLEVAPDDAVRLVEALRLRLPGDYGRPRGLPRLGRGRRARAGLETGGDGSE